MIELASETDFVAKNEQFQTLARRHRHALRELRGRPTSTTLKGETLKDGKTVEDSVAALAAVIGEKLELRRAVKLDGKVATYLHRKASDLPPQVGVLVQFDGDDVEAARGAAMQVAAMRAALPHPRRRPGRRRRDRAARRSRRRPARRASPSRRSPRSSRAASTRSTPTTCCSSRSRCARPRRRSSRCSTRPASRSPSSRTSRSARPELTRHR